MGIGIHGQMPFKQSSGGDETGCWLIGFRVQDALAEAIQTLERWRDAHVFCDAQRLAADGMAEEAVSLLERALLGEAGSPEATQAACTIVLRSLASARRADCADVAMQDMLDSGGVQLTAEMLNLVLAAYARDPQARTLRGLSDALSYLQVRLSEVLAFSCSRVLGFEGSRV